MSSNVEVAEFKWALDRFPRYYNRERAYGYRLWSAHHRGYSHAGPERD